jgi:hypothetical protein
MRDDIEKQVININLPDLDDDFFLLNGKEFLEMLYEVEDMLDKGDSSTMDTIINKMIELYEDK